MFQAIKKHIPCLSEKKQNNRRFKLCQMFRSWGEKANLQLSGSLVEGRNHHPSMKSLALFGARKKLQQIHAQIQRSIKNAKKNTRMTHTHDSDCLVWQIKNNPYAFNHLQ